jgi:hypothetical protein
MPTAFQRYYTASDFSFGSADSDITLTAGKWTEIGALQVGAQQQLAWGIGSAKGNVDTRRNVTLRIDHTDGNQILGVVRFAYANATKTDIRIVLEDRTENLDDGVPMSENPTRAREDSYLVIYVLIDGTSDKTLDVSDANTSLLAPATLYQ